MDRVMTRLDSDFQRIIGASILKSTSPSLSGLSSEQIELLQGDYSIVTLTALQHEERANRRFWMCHKALREAYHSGESVEEINLLLAELMGVSQGLAIHLTGLFGGAYGNQG